MAFCKNVKDQCCLVVIATLYLSFTVIEIIFGICTGWPGLVFVQANLTNATLVKETLTWLEWIGRVSFMWNTIWGLFLLSSVIYTCQICRRGCQQTSTGKGTFHIVLCLNTLLVLVAPIASVHILYSPLHIIKYFIYIIIGSRLLLYPFSIFTWIVKAFLDKNKKTKFIIPLMKLCFCIIKHVAEIIMCNLVFATYLQDVNSLPLVTVSGLGNTQILKYAYIIAASTLVIAMYTSYIQLFLKLYNFVVTEIFDCNCITNIVYHVTFIMNFISGVVISSIIIGIRNNYRLHPTAVYSLISVVLYNSYGTITYMYFLLPLCGHKSKQNEPNSDEIPLQPEDNEPNSEEI